MAESIYFIHSFIKNEITTRNRYQKGFQLKILCNLLCGSKWFESKNYGLATARRAALLINVLHKQDNSCYKRLLSNYSENSIKEFCNLSCNRLLALHLLERGNKSHGAIFYSSITGEVELPKSIANDSQKHHLHTIPPEIKEEIIRKLDLDDLYNFIKSYRSPTESVADAAPDRALSDAIIIEDSRGGLKMLRN